MTRVVVYGGSGFFGSLVVRDLLATTSANLVVVSRRRSYPDSAAAGRLQTAVSDLCDARATTGLVAGAAVVVNAAGPFQNMPTTLLEACIERGVPYVDLAEDRDFIERAHGLDTLARAAGIPVFVGCSVVPGLSSLLARACVERLPSATHLLIAISPGTKNPRGTASFACLLSTVGRAYSVPNGSGTRPVHGWTEPEYVEFPPPVGRRRVYAVIDVGDYFTAPRYFGRRSVVLKIGSESALLNSGLSLWRIVSSRLGTGHRRLLPFFKTVVGLASGFGSSRGGVMVRASDEGTGGAVAFGVARGIDGHIIPAILPAVAVARILAGRVSERGVVDLSRWITLKELDGELERRGVSLFRIEPGSGEWLPFASSRAGC